MACLTPIVNILFIFSATLGEGIGLVSPNSFRVTNVLTSFSQPFSPAKTIFTGIGVLLGVNIFLYSLDCIAVTLDLGGEGRDRKLRNPCQSIRVHSLFPPTSQPLHWNPCPARHDRITREDHGAGSLYPCAFDQVNERETNQSVYSPDTPPLANHDIEKFIKRLAGRTDVEDALERLDTLTNEENLMTVTRILEVTHNVDVNVTEIKEVMRDVHGNVVELGQRIDDKVAVVHGDIRGISANVEQTKCGAHRPFVFQTFADFCFSLPTLK
jgi:hypothetical protein